MVGLWPIVAVSLASGCFINRAGSGDAGPDRDSARGDSTVEDGAVPTDEGPPDTSPPIDTGPVVAPPGAPGAPTFTDVQESSVRIGWTAPSIGPVDRYELERADDLAGVPPAFSPLDTTLTVTSYFDDTLSPSTEYHYRVRAVNSLGAGPYSPSSKVRTVDPISVTLVQSKEADGTDLDLGWEDMPSAGNLLVAAVFYRLDMAAPSIAGWDLRLHAYFKHNDQDRRGLVILTKVAGASEPDSVRLQWTPSTESRMIIAELTAGPGVSFTFLEEASANSARDQVTSLEVTSPNVPAGETLVIAAAGTRDNCGSDMGFTGLVHAVTARGSRSVGTAFGQTGGGGPAVDDRLVVGLAPRDRGAGRVRVGALIRGPVARVVHGVRCADRLRLAHRVGRGRLR